MMLNREREWCRNATTHYNGDRPRIAVIPAYVETICGECLATGML